MKKYQQGDVVLMQVTKEQFDSAMKASTFYKVTSEERSDKRHELAYGEETGHCHAIYFDEMLNKAEVTVYRELKSSYWRSQSDVDSALGVIVKCDDAVIKHEEHNPVALPKGYYLQRIVKEYDPLSGLVRSVID